MKKNLLSLLFLLVCMCFQATVLAQQDTKLKPVSNDIDCILEIRAAGNTIFIECAPIGKKIEIFSIVGIKVKEFKIEDTSGEFTLSVPKGYYIIKLNDTFRKIAVR